MSKYCWYRVKYCLTVINYHTSSNAHTQILRTVKDFSRILSSWTRHRRNGVRFPKYPHGCSSRLRYSGPTFHFWTRWLVSWSWTRAHRADVHFNKHPHDLFQVPCGVYFQWFVPERSPSYPEVELGKAESQAFRVLSARSFWPLASKPRTVFASNRFSSYP